MSVTITLADLANQVRVSSTEDEADIPTGYVAILKGDMAAAVALVERRAPEAPDNAQNKAVVQIVGYWLQSPPSAPQRFGFNAWLHSGAAQVLAPFIERRAQAI